MEGSYIVPNGIMITVSLPKRSKWYLTFDGSTYGLRYHPEEGKEPNWIHRKLQEFCLGIKWRKN